MMVASLLFRGLDELGLISLYYSSADTKKLCAQRFVRLFAYGSSTLILVSYLSSLEITQARIGLFQTLTLVGDTVGSLVMTQFADSVGRRATLALGALLMIVAGVIFASCENFWVLLPAAIIGVISASGNECGPFRAIEESTIAQLSPPEKHGDIYAWYSLLGATGSAIGFGSCGWVQNYLLKSLRWDIIKTYRTIFWVYSGLGVVMLGLVLSLSNACEIQREPSIQNSELITADSEANNPEKRVKRHCSVFSPKVPRFSPKSQVVVIKLCLLFALDSFATGLAPLSWVTFFFDKKFNLSAGQLGTIFLATSLIAALSMLPASSLAKRLGNIKTMVLAHLPSVIFLAVIPIPSRLKPAMALLILRSCTQSMDTAPRSAFLASVVLESERTPMNSITYFVRSAAASVGPSITGVLAGKGKLWISFVAAGVLSVVYDLAILYLFYDHQPVYESALTEDKKKPEEQATEGDQVEESRNSCDSERKATQIERYLKYNGGRRFF